MLDWQLKATTTQATVSTKVGAPSYRVLKAAVQRDVVLRAMHPGVAAFKVAEGRAKERVRAKAGVLLVPLFGVNVQLIGL